VERVTGLTSALTLTAVQLNSG